MEGCTHDIMVIAKPELRGREHAREGVGGSISRRQACPRQWPSSHGDAECRS